MTTEKTQKLAVGLAVLGVVGLIADRMNKRSDKIFGMEPDTQRKVFLGMVLLGNTILLVTFLKK